MVNSLLAVLAGFFAGSLVNVFINFGGRYKPLTKWYFRLFLKDALSVVNTIGLGLIFYIIYAKIEFGFYSLSYMILTALLTAASIKDIQNRTIPNKLIISGFISGVILNCLFLSLGRVADSIMALVLAGGILLVTSFVSKGGVGIGDVKLMALTGFMLGIDKTISVMIISLLASALFGIFSILLKKLDRKSTVPFGPFVLIGVILTVLI